MTTPPTPIDPATKDAWLEESLSLEEAAEFLGVEKDWLLRKRTTGQGPRFTRLSPKLIVYVRRDLVEFRDSCAHSSTAEYVPQRLARATETASESTQGGEDDAS